MEKVLKNRKAWIGIIIAILVVIGSWWGWGQYQNHRVKSIIDGTVWSYSSDTASTYGQTLSGYDSDASGDITFLKGTNRVLTAGVDPSDVEKAAKDETVYESYASSKSEFNGTYTIRRGVLTIKNSDGMFEISNLRVGKASGENTDTGKRVTVPILLGTVKETNNQGVTKKYQLSKLHLLKEQYNGAYNDFPSTGTKAGYKVSE